MARELFDIHPAPRHDERSDIWAFGMVIYISPLSGTPRRMSYYFRMSLGIAQLESAVPRDEGDICPPRDHSRRTS